jgi:NAD(P)-dependent dehydrogenase (short-subunit alcohol dehydrogenase family)
MPDSVLITGVSTGIGAAAARIAAARGAHVFGSVRRIEAAAQLQADLGAKFTPLVFDVRDQAAVAEAAVVVREKLGGKRLGGLVNNAGIAVAGPMSLQPIAEFREQMEVNVIGPLIVTQAFVPLLGADPALTGAPGRIVNISSVAGKFSAPFLGGYAASKHALEGWTESLRRELMLFGIDVLLVAPGAVATPIWDKAEDLPVETYAGTGYPPEKVGEAIWTALTAGAPAVRTPVVINSFANWTVPRLLPRRTLDRIIAGRVGLKPRHS